MSGVLDIESQRSVENQFKRICFAPQWLCVSPLRFTDGKFQSSWPALVVCLVGVGVVLVLNITKDDWEGWVHADSTFKKIAHHVPVLFWCIFILCNSFWLLLKKNQLMGVFEECRDIQMALGHVAKFRNLYAKTFIITLFIEQIAEFIFYQRFVFPLLFHLNFFLLLLQFFAVNQFSSFLFVLRTCFQRIHEELSVGKIETQVRLHQRLCTTCRVLNNCYGPQLVLLIGTTFVMNTVHVYTIVMKYREAGMFDVAYIYFSSLYLMLAFLIIRSCRLTANAAKMFNALLYEMSVNDKSKSLIRNDKVLTHFRITKKLEFTGMGFFKLDYPLLCSMLYTTTTYTVILAQFS